MTVRKYMTANPIVARPETTLAEIARLLTDNRIGCVLVVDGSGNLAGIVTETDLFVREKRIPFSARRMPALAGEWVDPNHLEETYGTFAARTAADVMSRPVLTIDADATIGTAARLMLKHDRKRLAVTSGGKLVGVLTRHDLLRALSLKLAA